ncbi:histone acetyltransferase subunit NuA4, putative [Plasmodium reichenowi]|uniref:Histone acetyltransferase subunit NuA4, putative n=1 Tax=Plasmodium reichenowi TaxID=5854 RepID=A0A060RR82_PLARE|nr:histone acetyltransferase subunit NuA4, putative [Plasmodium reichenowi]KYN99185.1 histone acetyltransferase subunit NuA4, putative [Plasmodium reichenowi]CDO63863.1 histone acetyltransferase subunit NuA4, putative [Plasmodium reichenowi]SOV78438.1 histone acetyltransferase subunit NuA4, putative [Plasmodium reichenowi]
MKHKVKRDIMKCKKKLESSIKALEDKILRLESEYHKNCNVNGGNLIKGWESHLRKTPLEPLSFRTFRDDYGDSYVERMLSLTSCTSPATALFPSEDTIREKRKM